MNRCLVRALCLLPIVMAPAAWAGRPLGTDDAATVPAGFCQLESWMERQASDRVVVLAPACGLAPGYELGGDLSLPHPTDPVRARAGLALKVVPESWQADTPIGALTWGLKIAAGVERPTAEDWQHSATTALALVSLAPAPQWALHANLGVSRDQASGRSGTLYNLALVWSPSEHVLVFGEALSNNERDVFGPTVRTVGARWWLISERLGLDLTASRAAGVDEPTRWSIGFGWYGIGF